MRSCATWPPRKSVVAEVGITVSVEMVDWDGLIRVHLLPSATLAQRDLFARIETLIGEAFAEHYAAQAPVMMPDARA